MSNPNHTAKAPDGVTSWDRVRFQANEDDYRPIIWPPIGPYWCSGSGGGDDDGYSIVVAYVPHGTTDETIKRYWPEAAEIDRMQVGTAIEFSDRFVKPAWWLS